MVLSVAALAVGIVVLARAADLFVAGSAALSLRLGLSAVFVGAVVIGFGASPQEAADLRHLCPRAAHVGAGGRRGELRCRRRQHRGVQHRQPDPGPRGGRAGRRRDRRVVPDAAPGGPIAIGATVCFGWFVQGDLTRGQAGLRAATGLVGVVLGAQALVYGATDIAHTLGLSGASSG